MGGEWVGGTQPLSERSKPGRTSRGMGDAPAEEGNVGRKVRSGRAAERCPAHPRGSCYLLAGSSASPGPLPPGAGPAPLGASQPGPVRQAGAVGTALRRRGWGLPPSAFGPGYCFSHPLRAGTPLSPKALLHRTGGGRGMRARFSQPGLSPAF